MVLLFSFNIRVKNSSKFLPGIISSFEMAGIVSMVTVRGLVGPG